MKENQIESSQNVCWLKLTNYTKKASRADLKNGLTRCVKNSCVRAAKNKFNHGLNEASEIVSFKEL